MTISYWNFISIRSEFFFFFFSSSLPVRFHVHSRLSPAACRSKSSEYTPNSVPFRLPTYSSYIAKLVACRGIKKHGMFFLLLISPRHAMMPATRNTLRMYMYNNFRVCLGEQGRVVPIRRSSKPCTVHAELFWDDLLCIIL